MSVEPKASRIASNGITLEVAQAGPESGRPVVLLHGFPEPWIGWRHQIGPLAEAGYRVLAPDQRGYGRSDKPRRVADYALDLLAADVLGLIEAAGHERVALVGHDWGAIVAWWVAIHHPDRLDRLIILNGPHPVAFRRYVRSHPSQLLRSWYVFFFQLPGLPEWYLRRNRWSALTRALTTTIRPRTFSEEDLDRYRRAWSEPGAIRAMIHWYRAALRHRPKPPADPRVKVPTLLIWGARDHFLGPRLAEASLAFCDQAQFEPIADATHWVQHEEPERVNRAMLAFLAEGARPNTSLETA
jgi:pimeloyl-ACP methyl ester carboxylesterase